MYPKVTPDTRITLDFESATSTTAPPISDDRSLDPFYEKAATHLNHQTAGATLDNIKTSSPNKSSGGQVANVLAGATTVPPAAPSASATPPLMGKSFPPPDSKSSVKFGTTEQLGMYAKLSLAGKWHALTNGLTLTEAAAIHAYTKNEYYTDINNQFRTLSLDNVNISDPKELELAGVSNRDLALLISALVTGMMKLPPAQTDESYVAALGRNVDLPQSELDLYQQDEIVPMKTFISTTVSQQEMVSEHWWNSKNLAFFIYPGVKGNARDIALFSEFKREKEILFLPNTNFKVLFRGQPTLTEPGLDSKTGTDKCNPSGEKVTKLLIALQEVTPETPTVVHTGDNRSENKGTYFSMR